MNESECERTSLIIGRDFDLAFRNLQNDIKSMLATNSAKGLLRSGATIKQVCQAIEERYMALVRQTTANVAMVRRSPETFGMIEAAFAEALPLLEQEVRKVAQLASGRGRAAADVSILNAALKIFEQFKSDLTTELNIKRYDFADSAPEASKPPEVSPPPPTPVPPLLKNVGGKPLAKHWDEMWAAIAVQLWHGDLKPQSQADVKSAMLDWFNNNSIDIGDTAVTERARRLWMAMQAVD
jgi:hypothetical protein